MSVGGTSPVDSDQVLFTWEEQVAPNRCALVMVDLQNDFVHPEGYFAGLQMPGFMGDTGITGVLDRCSRLLDAAREADVLRVFVRMLGDDRYLSNPTRALYARSHGSEHPACVHEGSWGAAWAEGLGPDGSDRELVVDKHRYSSFIGTRLDQLLRSHAIETIVVCGVATSGCVESTVRDGFMLDYYAVTAGDACGDYEAARHAATLSKMQLSFGEVVEVDRIAKQWTA